MKRLAWIYRGPLANGQFQEMEEADLEQAVAEGWAQDVNATGTGMTPSSSFKPIEPGAHPAAERYATRVGTYATRIMEAGPASAVPSATVAPPVPSVTVAPPVPQQPATIPPPIPEPTIPPPEPAKDVKPAPSGPAPQKPVAPAKAKNRPARK